MCNFGIRAESVHDSEQSPVWLKYSYMAAGRSVVGNEVGRESCGLINICLHPRSSYINFNYHCLRVANVDNI